MMRGGPGLGTIQAGQADYFQATRAPGHGDGKLIVLAPSGIQEAVDLVGDAFDLADKYRNPVMILADGMIGQMMEPIVWKERQAVDLPPKDWAALGRTAPGQTHFVTSCASSPRKTSCSTRNCLTNIRKWPTRETRWRRLTAKART